MFEGTRECGTVAEAVTGSVRKRPVRCWPRPRDNDCTTLLDEVVRLYVASSLSLGLGLLTYVIQCLVSVDLEIGYFCRNAAKQATSDLHDDDILYKKKGTSQRTLPAERIILARTQATTCTIPPL